jgi:hypothetical protein
MVEQVAMFVVRLTTSKEKLSKSGYNLITLEFINNNKILFLREGRPL